MSGSLNQDIINLFKAKFESNCIGLILDAYASLLASGRKVNEESENNITAQNTDKTTHKYKWINLGQSHRMNQKQ